MTDQELYKPSQVCKMLKIKQDKLNSLCTKMYLDRINICPDSGRPTYRITKDSVDKFIKSNMI